MTSWKLIFRPRLISSSTNENFVDEIFVLPRENCDEWNFLRRLILPQTLWLIKLSDELIALRNFFWRGKTLATKDFVVRIYFHYWNFVFILARKVSNIGSLPTDIFRSELISLLKRSDEWTNFSFESFRRTKAFRMANCFLLTIWKVSSWRKFSSWTLLIFPTFHFQNFNREKLFVPD